ncbi:MAG: hypothetical protein U0930_24110, partial [Pirellulales bacterium]
MRLFVQISLVFCSALLLLGEFKCDAAETIGVIEIGAKGIKKIACEVTPNDFIWTNKGDFNADIASTWKGDKFDEQPFEEAMRGIADFVISLEKAGVPKNRIFAVVSSGAIQTLTEKSGGKSEAAFAELKRNLVAKGIDSPNIEVLDVQLEAALNYLDAASPRDGRVAAFDVGSGNSKVALGDGIPSSIKEILSWDIGPGTKRLGSERDLSKLNVDEQKVLRYTKTFYLSGGIGYVVASWTKPREFGVAATAEEYLVITLDDIRTFRKSLETESDKLFDEKLQELNDETRGDLTAAKNLLRAKGIFDVKQLDAGSWILESIFSKLRSGDDGVEVRIVKDGQFSVAKGWAKQRSVKLFGPRLSALMQEPVRQIVTAIEDLKSSSKPINSEQISVSIENLRKSTSNEVKNLVVRMDEIESTLQKIEASSATIASTSDRQAVMLKEILDELRRKAPGPGSPVSPLSDRESAVMFLTEAIRLRKLGQLNAAARELNQALKHSVMEADVWVVHAIVARELGDEATAQDSIINASKLIESGRFSRSKLAQSLEKVQG